jgi:hypothetical protein
MCLAEDTGHQYCSNAAKHGGDPGVSTPILISNGLVGKLAIEGDITGGYCARVPAGASHEYSRFHDYPQLTCSA